jgi:hypothetical protein
VAGVLICGILRRVSMKKIINIAACKFAPLPELRRLFDRIYRLDMMKKKNPVNLVNPV